MLLSANLPARLWGAESRTYYFIIVSLLLLGAALGGKELWTQEARWSDIVVNMLQTGDYFHPSLMSEAYYDKPLLSYWLMIAASWLTAGLDLISLRLPSMLAGLLTVYCTVQLGSMWFNRSTGLLAGWLLVTCYFFIFWSRVASSDMLNVAGMMLAVLWYVKRPQPSFNHYLVFFIILAVTSLCKGLIGVVLPLLVIAPHLFMQQRWRAHINLSIVIALIPAVLIYMLPFWLSSHMLANPSYEDSGLYLVFRENILRFFQPFDHQGPIYTYFLYLPIYGLPWTLLLFPALWSLRNRWSQLDENTRWLLLAMGLLFIFFTLSGSRRSYYVLPLIPFAILFVANWLQSHEKLQQRVAVGVAGLVVTWLAVFALLIPWYYSGGGLPAFANEIKKVAEQQRPWDEWQIVMLDADKKAPLYVHNDKPLHFEKAPEGNISSPMRLLVSWPVLINFSRDTIFVTNDKYSGTLDAMLLMVGYQRIDVPETRGQQALGKKNKRSAVAYVPRDILKEKML